MQFTHGRQLRNMWSCCLILSLCGWVSQQRAVSAAFADDEGRTKSVVQEQAVDRSPVQAEPPETGTQVDKRRISLRIALDTGAESQKVDQWLLADAAEIIDPAKVDGVGQEEDRVVKLRKDVQLWLDDDTVSASGDQAIFVVQHQKNSKAIVQSVKMTLSGNVRWTSGGLDATANELSVTLRPADQGSESVSRMTEFTLRGRARLNGGSFTGTADRIDVAPYPAKDWHTESSMRLKLDGNATLSGRTRNGGKFNTRGQFIEYVPNENRTRIDRLNRMEFGSEGTRGKPRRG